MKRLRTIVFFADGRIFPCFGGEHMASEYARYMFVDEFRLGSVHLLHIRKKLAESQVNK